MKPGPEQFLTGTLTKSSWGPAASRILAEALAAVDPQDLVAAHLTRQGDRLLIGDRAFDLHEVGQVILLAIGKAALPMALSAAGVLGSRLSRGFVLTKKRHHRSAESLPAALELFNGGHPVPDLPGLKAAAYISRQLEGLRPHDLVIALISGGGSALFTLPPENISLEDIKKTSRILLGCGADIQEINAIRKHLSQVKGGQLARKLAPANLACLILSDVIGDPLENIASGLTAPDPSTFGDAWKVVEKYRLAERLPPAALEHLRRGIDGQVPETTKPGDPVFNRVVNLVIGNNRDAVQGGIEGAVREGYQAGIIQEPLVGEARELGLILSDRLVRLVREEKPLPAPACLVGGGEATVTLPQRGVIGRGGRNLEIALSAVRPLDGLENGALITLASDGEDAQTDAAGAVVTGETCRRALALGLDPAEYLSRHDSYSFFKQLNDLIQPGPTGTNVNDLCLLISPE